MPDDLSHRTAIIYDPSGDHTHIAEAIVGNFGAVKFYSFWQEGFPDPKKFLPGLGLEGVERIDDFFDHLDDVDLVIFPDVGNGGLQQYLRGQGIAVFGSGQAGKLEQDRLLLKSVCAEAEIDTGEYAVVKGIDQLRAVLQEVNDLYVKLSWFRGAMETFHHRNWLSTQAWLDDVSLRLGPYGKLAEFVVEQPIEDDDGPCCEFGFDTFCADGVFPRTIMWGPEVKDAAYFGTTAPLPYRLQDTLDRLAPVLKRYNYRGAVSIESRCTEAGTFLIDFTARFGSPPSEVQSKYISNLADIMWAVAHGEIIEPEYAGKYCGQLVLRSEFYQDHALAVEVENPGRVALHGHCCVNKQDYCVSPSEIAEMGGACGYGDTMETVCTEMLEAAEGVKGYQVAYDTGAIQKGLECIETGEELGMSWGGALQSVEMRDYS